MKLFAGTGLNGNVGWDTWVKTATEAAAATTSEDRAAAAPVVAPPTTRTATPPGKLHKSIGGPGGPWAAEPLPFGCNNPAPVRIATLSLPDSIIN